MAKQSVIRLAVLLSGSGVLWAQVPPRLECPPPGDQLITEAPSVQLWAAPIDFLSGRAIHPHFTYTRAEGGAVHRAEVWQDASGPLQHVWIDEITPLHAQGMGLCLLGTRTGAEAAATIAQLDAAARGEYRWGGVYLPVPGPNSNTFAAAVLRSSGWDLALPRQAIGKRFPGSFSPKYIDTSIDVD